MAAKLPRKWVPSSHSASIRLKKIDKWAEHYARNGLEKHFDDWASAHAHLVAHAESDFARARKALISAERRLERSKALKPPASQE